MKLTIALADDHAMVRQGLRAFLATVGEIEVVGEAGDGIAALELIRETQPDLAIVDMVMPRMSGVDVVREAVRVSPCTAAIIFSMHSGPAVVAEAFAAGARGYVLKESEGEHLLEVIREVASGASRVLGKGVCGPALEVPEELTEREREGIALIAEGLTNRSIAARLAISVRTVEAHRASLMRKLSLHSSAELALYALRRGLVVPSTS